MSITRIDKLLVYASRPCLMEAELFNLWRRACLHLTMPMRIPLTGLKQMLLIVEEDAWVVVDEVQYDLPILAWVDFDSQHRDNLHKQVPCTLNYYHFMASSLRGKVLVLLKEAFEEKLYSPNPILIKKN